MKYVDESTVLLIYWLCYTRKGKLGLEIDRAPKETACAVPLLVSWMASSMETPSFAMRFPLYNALNYSKKFGS